MNDKLTEIFIQEGKELIDKLEDAILQLESEPTNKLLIAEVFRIMHTLKGNSNIFGLKKLGEYTHYLENIYDLIRHGEMEADKFIIDITFDSIDLLRDLIADPELSNSLTKDNYGSLMLKVKNLAETQELEMEKQSKIEKVSNSEKIYDIFFGSNQDILETGNNPFYILSDLMELGECEIITVTDKLPSFNELDPAKCYLSWKIKMRTSATEDTIRDIFLFVEDQCIVRITEQWTNTDQIDSPALAANNKLQSNVGNIRVSSEKLDKLMNSISELVTTQARLSVHAESEKNPLLVSIAENVESITRDLRERAYEICLVPVETLFSRYKRLVRDISESLGKQVSLITEDAGTEIDKSIIEKLVDPLMHLIRNSLDHGIEAPEERVKKGKPATGTLTLRSYYYGTQVFIEIADDGKGIDPETIKSKALKKGLINSTDIPAEEAFNLIFEPGFTTSENITDLSGRGVGMDVVRNNISSLRGEVEVHSKIDQGTKIIIKLPLTLSIIDGLLIRVEGTKYVIPLEAVEKCHEVKHTEIAQNFNDWVLIEGDRVPFIFLRREFNQMEDIPELEQVIITSYLGRAVALIVDEIIGQHQTVLQPLDEFNKSSEIFSGSSILGDGTVALVLDINKTIEKWSKAAETNLYKL